MIPYALSSVTVEDNAVFEDIRKVVLHTPDLIFERMVEDEDIPPKPVMSCHTIARGLARFFPVKLRDGFFLRKTWSHSWLERGSNLIIDPYPWAMIGGPVMVVVRGGLIPWTELYRPAEIPDLETPGFLARCELVEMAIGATMESLGLHEKYGAAV